MADIVLILDESTSIVSAPGQYTNWYTYILGFALNVASAFPISPNLTHVGVVEFSNTAVVQFYLNQYTDLKDLTTAINSLQINGGETDIAAALRTTRLILRNLLCT